MKFNLKLILFTICGALLCAANFVVLLILESKGVNVSTLATIISGWISGIATLCVGLIAYYQNKKITIENNRIVTEQAIINKKMMTFYSLQDRYFQILEIANPSIINLKIVNLHSNTILKNHKKINDLVLEVVSDFNPVYLNFETLLYSDNFNSGSMKSIRDRVHQFYKDYTNKLTSIVELKNDAKYFKNIDVIFKELDVIFKDFKKVFNEFIIKNSFQVEKDLKNI